MSDAFDFKRGLTSGEREEVREHFETGNPEVAALKNQLSQLQREISTMNARFSSLRGEDGIIVQGNVIRGTRQNAQQTTFNSLCVGGAPGIQETVVTGPPAPY